MNRPAVSNQKAADRPYDIYLLGSVLALLSLSLVMVSSASLAYAVDLGLKPWYFALRHALSVLLGLGICIGVSYIPMLWWRKLSLPLLIVNILFLGLLLLPGISRPVNGSLRWLFVGPISIQISEVTKLSIILYLAQHLFQVIQSAQRPQPWLRQKSIFLEPLIFLGMIAGLLLLEPDFGATVVIVGISMSLLFFGGAPLRPFALLVFLSLSALGLLAWISPYRLQRLSAFLDPWSDQFNSGYQLTQSLIAFGRGSWFGMGLGNSLQKLLYLPEPHTDFIVAVLAEELGLVGVLSVLLLFTVLVYRIFRLADKALHSGQVFSGFVAYGIGSWVAIQALINMGVSMGLLPTKGLTLPFMSYGGNSLVVLLLAIGLLLRIEFEWASKR